VADGPGARYPYQRNYSSPHDNRQLKIRTERAAGRQSARPARLTRFARKFYNAPQERQKPPAVDRRDPGRLWRRPEREAPVPVQMELKRIIINEVHDQQVIMLREVEGERSFPIVIGIFEATSIDRRVKGMPSPRPLTHDLVASVIEHLGGELQDIFISELRDHTYYAKLRIRQNGEPDLIEVDSRPSDAIALAVTAKVPIYVAEDVLNEVCGE
jgi:bifunctional DNase/RNase